MRDLMDEYGMVIVATVVFIMLITFAIKLKTTEGNVLGNIAQQENTKIAQKGNNATVQGQLEVEEEVNLKRNKSESAVRNYNKIVQMYESDIKKITASTSWSKPIETSSISAGVWNYPESFGGGVHLGIDYAASLGTEIKAPANGVIVVSSDGCGTGFLGDACSGSDENAVSYGGNQAFLLTIVNGRVYAFSFSHMDKGSVHKTGVIQQGETIGKVGASGNATGPHSHIEAFYLGSAEKYAGNTIGEKLITIMNMDWTASFGCGWGEAALNNISSATKESDLNDTRVVRFNPNILFKVSEN